MKKLFTVLLVVMMMFTLAGCGSSDNNSSNESGEVGSYVLRGSGPLTGPAALYGIAVQRGAQVAVDEINAKEGFAFFDYKLEDDAHDPETAVNAFYKMLDDKMQVSLLCVTSAPAASVAPLCDENDVFAITPSGSRDDVPTYSDNVFQMCFKDSNQGKASAQYMKSNFADSKIGVIYQSSVDYSKGIYNSFISEAKSLGLNIVAETSFTDEKDYSVQLAEVKKAEADLVFLPIYYDEASDILTQAGEYKPVWFGVDGMDGILGKEGFDVSLAEGTYLLTPFDATSTEAKSKAFTEKYVSVYNETPMQFAADAYDAVYAIYNGLKDGNCDPSMSASEIAEILRDQFGSMEYDGVTGKATWAANGEVSKTPMCVVIKDGAYATVE